MRVLALPLCKLLRACLARGFVLRCWQEARVVFIPKAGRALLGTVKDFRPISLTSFILKLMERLVDRYIREVPLKRGFLTRAYVDDVISIIVAYDQGIAVDLMRSALSIRCVQDN